MRALAFMVLGACVLLFTGGLVFRATLYWRLPVAAGEPYGIADIIEYGVYMLLIAFAVPAFVLGGILVIARRLALVRVGLALLVVGSVAPLVYVPLHSFVARVTVPSHG